MFKISYCDFYEPSRKSERKEVCRKFVESVSIHRPDTLKKQKIHLVLHLVDCMQQFEPTPSFNSERCMAKKYIVNDTMFVLYRCEAFNSFIRAHNIYGNKSAPSHDIAWRFSKIEHLRYICEGGYERLIVLNSSKMIAIVIKQLWRRPEGTIF